MNFSSENHYKINNNYIKNSQNTQNSTELSNVSNNLLTLHSHQYGQIYTDEDSESIIFTIITIIIGILLGVIIGYFIFRDIKYIGPDSNEIIKNIYKDDKGRLYKYKPKITICPMNYSMNKLHNSKFKETH